MGVNKGGNKMFKKIVIAISMVLLLAITGVANAKVYYLSLVAGSGTTTITVASGTSVMVANSGTTFIKGLYNFEQFETAIQVRSVSGLTVSESERDKDGDNSGVTFTLGFKESLINSEDHWAAAGVSNVYSGTLFSGTTLRQIEVDALGLGYMLWEFTTGITPIGRADFIFMVLD